MSFIFKGIKMLSRCRLINSNLVLAALNDTNHISPISTIQRKSFPMILDRDLLSSLVLPLTLLSPSNLTSVRSSTLARHRLLKLNSIFSSTYGPSTYSLIRLYKSYIRSLFDYGAPATCVASPDIQLSCERIQTHFISRALSIPSFILNDRKRQHAYLPLIHARNLYQAKRWYRRAMQHNCGVQDYIDNHTHDKRNIHGSYTTPWTDQELIFKVTWKNFVAT